VKLPWRSAFALIVTIVTVGSVVGVVWLIHSSANPVNTATVYAGYLAAAAIAVTVLIALGAWWVGAATSLYLERALRSRLPRQLIAWLTS